MKHVPFSPATHSARGHAAARSSDVATLKEIYKGSNLINIPKQGSGHRHHSCTHGCHAFYRQTKAVKVLLLELNADRTDPTIPEKDGYTPPHGAGFQVCSTSTPSFQQQTPLQITCQNNHLHIVGSFKKARQQKTTSQHGLTN